MKKTTLLTMAMCSALLGFSQLNQINLPINWEGTTTNYAVTDFGGNASSLAVDPTSATNMVLKSDKTAGAQLWAGTTLSSSTAPTGLATAIPFSAGNTTITVKVYSPHAGIQVRLKAEDKSDPTKSVETEATVTVANGWQTLTFNFANQAAGTAAINFAYTYNMLSIFYNFGVDGATAGLKTYYCDDVTFGGTAALTQINLPINWEGTTTNYTVTDFGGTASSLTPDPANASNTVLKTDKTVSAQTWGGTTLSTSAGLATDIPFSAGNTIITVKVYSPNVGMVVRLKAEDHTNNTITVETDVTTTVANAWETLTFNFANQVTGTPAINFANSYDMLSIFYNFGVDGATAGLKTFYCDDITFGVPLNKVDLPITFDDATVDYKNLSFGGALDTIMADPTNATNNVLRQEKPAGAQTWAGTTMGSTGLATAIPFTTTHHFMTARVWSATAGVPVLLKVEDASNGTISVETIATTTVAGGWQTLTFDFTNNSTGTPAIDYTKTYDKVSIFCDFLNPATGKTFYIDDVTFSTSGIGISEAAWANNFLVTPNPTNGLLHIQAELTNSTEVAVSVTDIQGKIIYQTSSQGASLNQTIDLGAVNSGMYLVSISSEFGILTEKIFVIR